MPMSDHAVDALSAYLDAGPAAHGSRGRPRTLLQQAEERLQPTRYPFDGGTIWRYSAAGQTGDAAHVAALVRHPSVGRGSRHPSGTGAAGARERGDHAAIHPCIPGSALRGLRAVPPEGLTVATAKKPASAKTAPKPATKAKPKPKPRATSARAARVRPATATITIPPHVDDELGGHWHEFKTTGAVDAAREADLALRPAGEVRGVARRDRASRQRRAGRPGELRHVRADRRLTKFEPGRGNKFETYAIPRIKGAIIDELRAMDWVPRSIRFKAREIEKAHTDLEAMLKRQPTEQELAERLGISLRELHDVVSQISFVSVLALDEMVSVGSRPWRAGLADRHARRPGDRSRRRGSSPRRRAGCSPRPSTSCPSARRSS